MPAADVIEAANRLRRVVCALRTGERLQVADADALVAAFETFLGDDDGRLEELLGFENLRVALRVHDRNVRLIPRSSHCASGNGHATERGGISISTCSGIVRGRFERAWWFAFAPVHADDHGETARVAPEGSAR